MLISILAFVEVKPIACGVVCQLLTHKTSISSTQIWGGAGRDVAYCVKECSLAEFFKGPENHGETALLTRGIATCGVYSLS